MHFVDKGQKLVNHERLSQVGIKSGGHEHLAIPWHHVRRTRYQAGPVGPSRLDQPPRQFGTHLATPEVDVHDGDIETMLLYLLQGVIDGFGESDFMEPLQCDGKNQLYVLVVFDYQYAHEQQDSSQLAGRATRGGGWVGVIDGSQSTGAEQFSVS
jgi:hypothetical protein